MKVSGTADLDAAAETAFERLLDPSLLKKCIPGCERMDETSPGSYDTVIKAGVGAVKGSFQGKITLADVERPTAYRLLIEGRSTVGHVHGDVWIRLEEAGEGTRVNYDADARISGLIAAVGARLIDSAAKKLARQFFEGVASEIAED